MSRKDREADLPCRCMHTWAAHEHYRRGTECAICPEGTCAKFRALPAPSLSVAPLPTAQPIPVPTPQPAFARVHHLHDARNAS